MAKAKAKAARLKPVRAWGSTENGKLHPCLIWGTAKSAALNADRVAIPLTCGDSRVYRLIPRYPRIRRTKDGKARTGKRSK